MTDRIVRIGGADALHGFPAERVIDASGLVVMPGLVDLCARLRDQVDFVLRVQAAATASAATTDSPRRIDLALIARRSFGRSTTPAASLDFKSLSGREAPA